MASELPLARPSPIRSGLKPLVLSQLSASSTDSSARGPLGTYHVETLADRPIIVQCSRPSPIVTSRKCSGPRRRRVPSGRIVSSTQRHVSREVAAAAVEKEPFMQFVFSSPTLDELNSSPDLPPVRRVPRAAGQRNIAAARRARSETFAFPAPPSYGLTGLGLGPLPEMAAHRNAARAIPDGTQWLQDVADYVNGPQSPGLTHGLTGTQGWSPASSVVSSPEASPVLRPTKPLAVHKRNATASATATAAARRAVSQPAHLVQHSSCEPEEYPFPSSISIAEDSAARLQRLQASLEHLRLASPTSDAFWQQSSTASALSLALQEHRAPSLAEQMAFACGLGSDLEWEAPRQTDTRVYTSASAYLATSARVHEDLSPSVQRDDEVVLEDETSFWMVPHTREAAEDQGAQFVASASSESAASSQLSTPGSEALSATSSFSFAAESVASSATSLGAEGEVEEKQRQSSPLIESFDEFTYILAATAGVPASPKLKQASVACQIFSPALDTPALGLLDTPAPMDNLPSPVFSSASISPQLALASTSSCMAQSRSFNMARQQSNTSSAASTSEEREVPSSVLARPRPVTRKTGCFGAEMERGSSGASWTASPASSQGQPSPVIVLRQTARKPVHVTTPITPATPVRRSSRSLESVPCVQPASAPAPVVTAAAAAAAAAPTLRRIPVPTPPRATLPRSHSELLPSMPPKGPVPVLSARALAEVREACRQKQAFLRAAATSGHRGSVSSTSSSSSGSGPSAARVHFSKEQAPAMRSTLSATSQASTFSSTSSSNISTRSAPAFLSSSAHSNTNEGGGGKMSASHSLPTLFVARTASQRKRGTTGIPATEPSNQALAKLGFATKRPTRHSTVHALAQGSAQTPSGVVLVVEETVQEEGQVLVVM